MLPLLNYTWLNETLTETEQGGSLYKRSKDPKHMKKENVAGRFFPRWNALSRVVNKNTINEDGINPITSAIMIAGDSKLENEIGVGNGFPQIDLARGEIIILQDILDVLGVNEGETIEI